MATCEVQKSIFVVLLVLSLILTTCKGEQTCDFVEPEVRVNCNLDGGRLSGCENLTCCFIEEDPYWCSFPEKCSIERQDRISCTGQTYDDCLDRGCCWFSDEDNIEGGSECFLTKVCAAVPVGDRIDCGHNSMTDCLNADCCFDTSCFHTTGCADNKFYRDGGCIECNCQSICDKNTGTCGTTCTYGFIDNDCQTAKTPKVDAFNQENKMNSGQPTTFRCRVTANEADTTVTLTTSSRSHHGDVTSGNHPDYEFSNTYDDVVVAKGEMIECKVMPGDDRKQIIADAYIQPVLTSDPWITDIAKNEMKVNWYEWDSSVDIGDGPIENYEVWYKVANDNEFELYGPTAAHQTYSLITGLTPYMSYTFAVRTYRPGDGGGGDLGPAVSEQTLCDVPLGIPTMKTAMAVSENEILVTWEIDEAYLEPEILRCDSVTSYTIHYRVNGTSIEYETRATGPDQKSLLLDELDPCTEYEISVTMDNSMGHGKLSDPLFNTTLSSPTPIQCPVFNGVTILLSCISLILFIVLILIFLGFIYFKRTGKMWNCLLPYDIDKESVPMQPINSKQGKTITEDDTHRNHTYADPDDVIIKQCKTQDQENNYATFQHDESEYESLADATRQTKTTIPATDMKEVFANLLKTDQETNESYLHLEWQELNKTKFTPKRSDCSSGRRPNNANKNRFMNVLPLNKNRVKLVTVVKDIKSTDYINASYVDAFSVKNGFLVTQFPLPHTVIDFWRLVYDHKSNTIVMLNDTDKDNPTKGQYWPVDDVCKFGPFKIELLQTREIGYVVNRVLKLIMGDQNPSIIQQFQLLGWPPDISTSQFTSSFLELMIMIKRWQEQSGQRPTVVHCLNGVGRSGVFCAAVSACERIKAEQLVDIFQAVNLLRKQRPNMVETLEQYRLCYEAVLQYCNVNVNIYDSC